MIKNHFVVLSPLITFDVPPKDGVDIVAPPALVIVISPVVIVSDKFC